MGAKHGILLRKNNMNQKCLKTKALGKYLQLTKEDEVIESFVLQTV
jgi:hypothetical protein